MTDGSQLAAPQDRSGAGMSRRALLRRAGIGVGTILVADSGALGYRAYDQGVLEVGQGPAYAPWATWQEQEGLRALVAAAILAPNPHNTQPWLFRLAPGRIDLFADPSRNIGAIDPFKREKYVGLGAALENLNLAAQATGYASRVTLMPAGLHSTHAARVELARSAPHASDLYRQIARRHTNRYPYVKGQDIPATALAAMAALGSPETANARVFWFTGRAQRTQVGELLVAATEAIVADADQSRSDYDWFRQTWDEIQRQRDGITVDASGLSDLTAALAKLLPAQSRTATDEAWLDATRDRQTKTAAAYGIIAVHDASDNRQRLEGGRLLERVHLWITGHGLALQHMNQLTERADRELELALKPQFGDALRQLVPSGWQALTAVRIGYPTHTPHKSPRRPLEAVILT
jgi:nitroreductase